MKDTHLITTYFWLTFMTMNLLLVVAFALARLPIMNGDNFTDPTHRPPSGFLDALYISVMHQSTIGASHLIPTSALARGLSVLQSFSIIAVYGVTIYLLYNRLSK